MPLLSQLLEKNIEAYGEYPFLYYRDEVLTNLYTKNYANKLATGLKTLEVEQGDRIIVCMPNCPEVIFFYQAILRAGAIIVPVMYLLHAKEIEYIIKNSKAKAVIPSSDALPKVKEAIDGANSATRIIVVDRPTDQEVTNIYDLMDEDKLDVNLDTDGIEEETDPAVIL